MQIPANFGHTSAEQLLFENYVYQSLFNNYPVLFGYTDQNDGHAILITGININENNPGETQYTYLDPTDGAQMTFLGREISNYIHIDGELVGFGAEPDFQKDVLQVVVENEEIDKNDISDNENHEVIRMQLDLTATTGAKKLAKSMIHIKN